MFGTTSSGPEYPATPLQVGFKFRVSQRVQNGVESSRFDGSVFSLNVLECHLANALHPRSLFLWMLAKKSTQRIENQTHSHLRLNGRPPEHGFKVTCANVEITSADVHTTDDVQTFLADAKLMRSQALESCQTPQNWRPIFGRWQKQSA